MRESRRYLGLELSGAKNQKTALAVLEYYPTEKKIFLLDIFDRVAVHEGQSADEALLELIADFKPGVAKLGVNVPLQLPPCTTCMRKACVTAGKCAAPAVQWMRSLNKKASRGAEKKLVREFTPYTQRPVELWIRYRVLPKLPESHRFEIDETLGGNKAPLTMRMDYLKRHLRDLQLVEVWPKLTVAILALELGLSRRTIVSYRHLEEGIHAREEILEKLVEEHGVFIYERDVRKLAHSLASFDAFICAYSALLADIHKCTRHPAGFPVSSGWVQFPEFANG